MRLIDADTLLEYIQENLGWGEGKGSEQCEMLDIIRKQPTIYQDNPQSLTIEQLQQRINRPVWDNKERNWFVLNYISKEGDVATIENNELEFTYWLWATNDDIHGFAPGKNRYFDHEPVDPKQELITLNTGGPRVLVHIRERMYENPFVTTVNYIIAKGRGSECISTKENSKGFCLIFIVDIEAEKVVDVVNTDIFFGQLMDDSCYDYMAEIGRNLQEHGYELDNSNVGQTQLVCVIMLYSDYCNTLTPEEVGDPLGVVAKMYRKLFPKRCDYIIEYIYSDFFPIKSPLIKKREFTPLSYDDFLWSNFET